LTQGRRLPVELLPALAQHLAVSVEALLGLTNGGSKRGPTPKFQRHLEQLSQLPTPAINNVTTGQSFSTSTKVNSAKRSSAEWIAEAPSGFGGILPLADFGTAVYGADNTGVTGTSEATVSGTTAPIGSFGSNVYQITMVSVSDPSVSKAVPSSLSSDGSSFSDVWVSSGP